MATKKDFKVKKGLIVSEGITLGGHTFDDIDIGSEFVDTDDHIMSSGAIKEKIESYSYIASLAADSTPQLGGDLDVNGNSIVTTSNADINIAPNGTGSVLVNYSGSNNSFAMQVAGNANNTIPFTSTNKTTTTNAIQTSAQFTNAITSGSRTTGFGSQIEFRIGEINYAGYVGGIIGAKMQDTGNTNFDMFITPQGTGNLALGNFTLDADQTVGSGQDNYVMTYDHSAGTIGLEAASGGASDLDGLSDAKSGGTDFTDSLLIGHETHGTLDNALYNTGVGIDALDALTSGDSNVAVGRRALSSLNTGVENTFVGRNSGFAITSGNRNIGIGHKAADGFDTESDNIAIGDDALGGSIAGGEKNIAIGNGAGGSVSSGDENTIVGHNAGYQLSTGASNVAIGAYALENSDVGSHNIAIGFEALECGASNSDVDDNVAIGTAALKAAIDGTSGNVAIGKFALTVATKDDNVAVGLNAANSITTGERNVMIGTDAGHALADDSNSVIIGYQAGDNLTEGNGNVIIGCYTDAPSATDSGQLVIGTSTAINSPYYWILGDSTGAITFNHKADVVAVSGNTILTLAQTGSYVYWTDGTLTLPASGTVGTQYTVINNTGGSATVAVNASNCSMVAGFTSATNATTAIADHELASFVCVTANTWIQVG